jgi:predicted MFS family arabinose efflux permease
MVTIVGYCINMVAVPALALAGNWPVAGALVIGERTGRAIRKPATGAMISFAGKQIGQGWVFGLNEALDQTGAAVGPLVIALVLARSGNYRAGFAWLVVPALATIAVILIARRVFPAPRELEPGETIQVERFTPALWIYAAANACIAAGLADFALIGFHFQRTHSVAADEIPIYYAAAMASGAIGGVVFGRWFDKRGIFVLIGAFALSAWFAPLVFHGTKWPALLGMILWGIGVAAQGSLTSALVAGAVGPDKRSSAFGIFDTLAGIAWFAGSWLMGILYARWLTALISFSVAIQLCSIPLFLLARRRAR